MFGMGFTEIVLIAIVAIIFLGPDKLPEAMINIAKFFRSFKTTVSDAKNSLEQELNISELKKEAQSYKDELALASNELNRVTQMANVDIDLDEFKPGISKTPTPKQKEPEEIQNEQTQESEKVTFKKRKKEKSEKEDKKNESNDEKEL